LRNDLGLKGTKFGCGLEQCGSEVIVDGEAVPCCRLSVGEVEGKQVVTIEGLGTVEKLHPVQRAFADEQATQCGFCTGGMIVAAKALLDQNPEPADDDIRRELAVHLCRCGTCSRVLKAIRRASKEIVK
jgi:nicotinate dehydrogenase subunit A